MTKPLNVLQPGYYARFRCIGPDCEDTCCAGAGVAIDKATFEKYRACEEPTMKAMFDENIAANPGSRSDNDFAFVTIGRDLACPFLTAERLCVIQKRLGEGYLSRTCATFPRAMSTVDTVTERSLYLSCPEAARLALLGSEPMRFEEIADEDTGFAGFPELDTANAAGGKPYRYFHDVRRFTISLLQNRNFPVWKRLIVLGMFCEELDKMATRGTDEGVPELIESFTEHFAAGGFEATLENIAPKPGLQVSFLVKAMEYRIGLGSVGQRFLDCYNEFIEGIDYSPALSESDLGERSQRVYARYAEPFLARHGYILEHYLVNYVFRSLFPFGPQTGTYVEQKTIFIEFLYLAVHYSLIRSLLVGMAGYHKVGLGPDHAVKLVQSFAKAVEHNLLYLKRVAGSLAENNMANLAVLAFLIKN